MNFALGPPKLFQAEYGSFSTDRLMEQGGLFPVRVRNRLAICPNGADIEFAAFGHDGRMYYAKGDRAGGPGRFTDALGTRLARHLGIATADHVILEDEDGTDTFFGSHHHSSTATEQN